MLGKQEVTARRQRAAANCSNSWKINTLVNRSDTKLVVTCRGLFIFPHFTLLILKTGCTQAEMTSWWLPGVHLCLPEHVVDCDDVLFVHVLSVTDDCRACL